MFDQLKGLVGGQHGTQPTTSGAPGHPPAQASGGMMHAIKTLKDDLHDGPGGGVDYKNLAQDGLAVYKEYNKMTGKGGSTAAPVADGQHGAATGGQGGMMGNIMTAMGGLSGGQHAAPTAAPAGYGAAPGGYGAPPSGYGAPPAGYGNQGSGY